jgi:hypothetical protein
MQFKLPVNIIILTFILFLLFDPVFAHAASKLFSPGTKPNGFIFSIYLFTAIIAALAVHELGHLLTGLAQGFRFELFVVFLLGVRRTEKGIKFYLNTNLSYMGGIAATVPITHGSEIRLKFAGAILAGPIASLLFAIICFLLMAFTKNTLWWLWLVAGGTSAALFLATTLPRKSGIFFTDRARFQRLMSKGQEGKSEEALLSLIAQSTIDSSCKTLSLNDARTLQADTEAFMRFWGYYYEYEHFKANDNVELTDEAKAKLISIKTAIPDAVWKSLKIE